MLFKKNKASGLTAEIRVKRCYGCGAILQSEDPNEPGYVPKEKCSDDEETLCERCYKLRHYSQYKESGDLNIDYYTILDSAKDDDALAVYVLNAFSLKGSLLEGISKALPKKVLVVINKRDLLPKSYNDEYLLDYTRSLLKGEGIEPLDILVTSSSSKTSNIPSLLEDINRYRDGKDVYFIGVYQVGKSSLINALLMDYTNSTDRMITTSPYPGTTLEVIQIPLDEKSNMYDTPGIYNSHSIITKCEPKILKYVLPRNGIKPESYATKEGQSFLLSNLLRIDFDKGEKTVFTFYKSNDLTLQRAKINKADELFESLCKNPDSETGSERITSLEQMDKTVLNAIKDKKNRIRIYGLGFVEFDGKDQQITVFAPKGVKVEIEDCQVNL